MNEVIVSCKSSIVMDHQHGVVLTEMLTAFDQQLVLMSRPAGLGSLVLNLHVASFPFSREEIRALGESFANRKLEQVSSNGDFGIGLSDLSFAAQLSDSHIRKLIQYLGESGENSLQIQALMSLQVIKFLRMPKPVQSLSTCLGVPMTTLNRRLANAKLQIRQHEMSKE